MRYTPPQITVSIHAPVRGATKCLEECGEGLLVSIHAPVRGATVEGLHREQAL